MGVFQRDFEVFGRISLESLLPKLDSLGIDLLKVLFITDTVPLHTLHVLTYINF